MRESYVEENCLHRIFFVFFVKNKHVRDKTSISEWNRKKINEKMHKNNSFSYE